MKLPLVLPNSLDLFPQSFLLLSRPLYLPFCAVRIRIRLISGTWVTWIGAQSLWVISQQPGCCARRWRKRDL